MARLQLTDITKCYGDFKAVDDVSLDIADGEFLLRLRQDHDFAHRCRLH
jgi:putative spermidine/putrescine transport system ATP-binding protein